MNSTELRGAFGLAGIYGSRMLGLFLILPVFAIYADELENVTPWLVGIAIGIYGLTQALLQIPFGLLSDKIGRKPVIIAGLILFSLGSVVAALSTDIYSIIFGRALQGSGAIAAVIMALAADLTRESQRTKAMALIGMSIGMSFILALISGPMLYSWIGISGIFWLTALLALLGIFLVVFVIPSPPPQDQDIKNKPPVGETFKKILSNITLLRLDFGIFSLHLMLTALFLAVPLQLRDAGLALDDHSLLYLGVLVFSLVTMVPFIIIAEKKGKIKQVYLLAISILFVAQIGFIYIEPNITMLAILLAVFFFAFNLLEALLPSLVSKVAPAESKGAAMGVYSTSQFLGAFLGGFVGGWLMTHYEMQTVFVFSAAVSLIWLLFSLGLTPPPRKK